QFEVATPDARRIRSAALVRASSVTHTNNMDQRYVGVAIEQVLGDRLVLRAPRDGTVAPPGHYMLFILDEHKVPSEAPILRLSPGNAGLPLLLDRTITVSEATAGDLDAGIDLQPGDEVEFEAGGGIWAGVLFTGQNGPEGWNGLDSNPKFPVH